MAEGDYPAGHLAFIQTTIPKPLTVFLPPMHRHMDAQYVSALREHGRLRISSFTAFKQHKSEQQGDRGEGAASSFINDTKNDSSFYAVTFSGGNAYALSATMRTGPEVAAEFGDSSFEIFDPIRFCAEVANEIPGCTHAMIGQCIYVDQRMLVSSGKAPTVEELRSEVEPENLDLGKLMTEAAKMKGPKPYFLKTRKHEWQAEFRFIWETNKSAGAYLDIVLPGRHQCCKF